MKKRFLGALTALFVCLAILSACGQNPSTGSSVSTGGGEADPSGGGAVLLTCRIISGAGEGELLLAEQGQGLYGGTGVYTLSVGQIPVLLDGASASAEDLENGMLVEINCSGMVEETFPARLGGVTALSAASGADGGFDNLCTLYLQVLEDLWKVDDGLNQGITELGVDLSQTRLTASERSAVAWAFGQAHGLAPVEGTYEELADQGYLDPIPASAPATGSGEEPVLYQWEDGCLFSIVENQEDPVVFSLPNMGPGDEAPAYNGVRFDAQKWCSPLGAYYFSDCTAVSVDGRWNTYTVGAEAIS